MIYLHFVINYYSTKSKQYFLSLHNLRSSFNEGQGYHNIFFHESLMKILEIRTLFV